MISGVIHCFIATVHTVTVCFQKQQSDLSCKNVKQ